MASSFYIQRFSPLFLTVFGIGPFQTIPMEVDFTTSEREPCNFYLLASANGRGKTTLLDVMAAMMRLLGDDKPQAPHPILWAGENARAQLDVRLTVNVNGENQTYLLTLAVGSGQPQMSKSWEVKDLADFGMKRHMHLVWRRRTGNDWEVETSTDEVLREFLALVRQEQGSYFEVYGPDSITAPTLLHFDAYRDIPPTETEDRHLAMPGDWHYRPLFHFGHRGEQWLYSLDNLFIWLNWLDDGRFNQALEHINSTVFRETNKYIKGVNKARLETMVINDGHLHRLDQLSSGEKSLLTLLLRIHAHMTLNTLILIDEMDVHLHPKWQQRILLALKTLVMEIPGITVIATTHSIELINTFAAINGERNLRTGGLIIEKSLL